MFATYVRIYENNRVGKTFSPYSPRGAPVSAADIFHWDTRVHKKCPGKREARQGGHKMNRTVRKEQRIGQRIPGNRIRRRRIQRCLTAILLTFILALGFSTFFFSLKIRAQNRNEAAQHKCYKSIAVGYGDTLWDYADRYGDEEYYETHEDYIDEVMNINLLTDDRIISGQYLIVPYYIP